MASGFSSPTKSTPVAHKSKHLTKQWQALPVCASHLTMVQAHQVAPRKPWIGILKFYEFCELFSLFQTLDFSIFYTCFLNSLSFPIISYHCHSRCPPFSALSCGPSVHTKLCPATPAIARIQTLTKCIKYVSTKCIKLRLASLLFRSLPPLNEMGAASRSRSRSNSPRGLEVPPFIEATVYGDESRCDRRI